MFLISVRFRAARSKKNGAKPGVVFYKITGKPSFADVPKLERNVNSDIRGLDSGVMQTEKAVITSHIRLLYCIIERREKAGIAFTTDDVTADFRKALAGEESMAGILAEAKTDFPIKRDIVNVSRWYKGDFDFVYEEREIGDKDSVAEYISNLSRHLKNEKRNSQSHHFLSLLSSLLCFVNDRDLRFSRIDRGFIHDYAAWLKQTGITGSTQSFYLRTLRTILNKAQKDGHIEVSPDWFMAVNTRIYKSSDLKDVPFSRDALRRIEKLDLTSNGPLGLVRDMFMFGFYCGGLELIDVANLTNTNIKDGVLTFRRRLKGHSNNVLLGPSARKILSRYSDGGEYLFPLLDRFRGVLFNTVRNYVAKGMKDIGQLIGFPKITFGMNVLAYKSLVSSTNISELLLK